MKNSTKLSKVELDALNKYAVWGLFWKIEIAVIVIGIGMGLLLYLNNIDFGIDIISFAVIFAILYPIIMAILVNSTNKNQNAFVSSETINHYEFTEDYFIENTEKDGEHISMTKLTYDKFLKGIDYGKYIFLFISKAQAYIIDKDCMSVGTVEGLLELLERKGIKIKKVK